MTPDYYARAKRVFMAAVELPSTEREQLLQRECADDDELRTRVAALLVDHDRAPTTGESITSLTGTYEHPEQIAGNRILSVLGEGGMGIVYLAEQTHPIRRQVALKVIKPGMDSKAVIARFDAERQALALMDHPAVAKVYDAGATDQGRPYFVMEYVTGCPITAYADEHRLPTKQRLQLFMEVCHAVQHAHQKGIIHRDLKPSNVLVTEFDGKPAPKVIDFGVAKAISQSLTKQTLFTEQGQFIGTPEYMSPEQAGANGVDIDTRSDVYSLGVLLYELLAGALPFDSRALRRAGYAEIQRIIREVDPPKPSTQVSSLGDSSTQVAQKRRTEVRTLSRSLLGDLDSITMKALEKERARRYVSPSDLAADIQRHLMNEPILAASPTTGHRLRKFVKRHKGLVVGVVAVLVVLVAGATASTWFAIQASRQKDAAKRRFEDVHSLAKFFIFEFNSDLSQLSGATGLQKLLVAKALEYLDKLVQDGGDDPSLLSDLASAYAKLGDTQGGWARANLGAREDAIRSYYRALEIDQKLVEASPEEPLYWRNLCQSHLRVGDMLSLSGQSSKALLEYKRAQDALDSPVVAAGTDSMVQRDRSVVLERIAEHLIRVGRVVDASTKYKQSLKTRMSLAQAHPENAGFQRDLWVALNKVGESLERFGRHDAAREKFEDAAAIAEQALEQNRGSPIAQTDRALSYDLIGESLLRSGNAKGALSHYRKAQQLREALAGADPENRNARGALFYSFKKVAAALSELGDTDGALRSYHRAIDVAQELSDQDPGNREWAMNIASAQVHMGMMLAGAERRAEASTCFGKAVELRTELLNTEPNDLANKRELAVCYYLLGVQSTKDESFEEALKYYLKAHPLFAGRASVAEGNVTARRDLVEVRYMIGETYASMAANEATPQKTRAHHWGKAKEWFGAVLETFSEMKRDSLFEQSDSDDEKTAQKKLDECTAAIDNLILDSESSTER